MKSFFGRNKFSQIRNLQFLVFLCFFSRLVFAQELPVCDQYLLNEYLINPAVCGKQPLTKLCLTDRLQWAGVEGAPHTGTVSVLSQIGKRHGIGSMVFFDNAGLIANYGFNFSYSFHSTIADINKDKLKLAFGVNGSIEQYGISSNRMKPLDSNDPLLNGSIEKIWVPDASIGLNLYSNSFYLGASVKQLVQHFIETDEHLDNDWHTFVYAGTFLPVQKITIEPSVLFKKSASTKGKIDMNLRLHYKDLFWIGASYRKYLSKDEQEANTILALLGMPLTENMSFGYAFTYSSSPVMSQSAGTHQLALLFLWNKKSSDVICPAYSNPMLKKGKKRR